MQTRSDGRVPSYSKGVRQAGIDDYPPIKSSLEMNTGGHTRLQPERRPLMGPDPSMCMCDRSTSCGYVAVEATILLAALAATSSCSPTQAALSAQHSARYASMRGIHSPDYNAGISKGREY